MAKISIQQAASALAKKGYRLLGPGPYDLKTKSASYRVVDPNGQTTVLTQEQVKDLMSTPALKRARALSLAKRRLSLAEDDGGDSVRAEIKAAGKATQRAIAEMKKWGNQQYMFGVIQPLYKAEKHLKDANWAAKPGRFGPDGKLLSLATPGGYRPQGQKLQLFIDKITNTVGNLDIIWRSEKNPDAAQSIALGRKITRQIESLLADLESVASDLDSIYDKER